MNTNNLNLKIIQAIFIVPICFVMTVYYGYSALITIEDKSGLNSSFYIYYDINKYLYVFVNLIFAIYGLKTLFKIAVGFEEKNEILLNKTFLKFLIFLIIVVCYEIYMNTQFIGKV